MRAVNIILTRMPGRFIISPGHYHHDIAQRGPAATDMITSQILLTNPLLDAGELLGQHAAGGGAYIPHGLASIAAYAATRGHEVEIIDNWKPGASRQAFIERLKAARYQVVGIGGCFTSFMQKVDELARLIKETLPDCRIIVGGAHPTIYPVETMEKFASFDFLGYNEGELIFSSFLEQFFHPTPDFSRVKGLVHRHQGVIVMNPPEQLIRNLDDLPMIDYRKLGLTDYVPPPSNYKVLPTYGLLIQRGCPYQCIYCDCRIHGHAIRQHSVARMIDEVDILVREHGMKGILFHDSVFTIRRDWVVEFCQKLIERNYGLRWMCYTRVDRVDPELLALMRRAGCWCISYGLESGNPESLKLIRKNTTIEQAEKAVQWTRKVGIEVVASLILCLPGEDEARAMNTVRFAVRIGVDVAVFFLPVPFPGTELYDVCKREGGVMPGIEWADYRQWMDQTNPLYVNPKIGKEGMIRIYRRAYRDFYLNPRTLVRTALRIRSPRDLNKYLKGFFSIAGILADYVKSGGWRRSQKTTP